MIPAIGIITDSSTAPMTMDSAATMVGSMMETRLEMPSSNLLLVGLRNLLHHLILASAAMPMRSIWR